MPSASTAKLEKQASTEAVEPIKQGIIIIEHKIRNLEKRKSRLDGYKALQKSGKELSSDQQHAVSKFDEVIQSLEFAKELCKQFTTISVESAKQQKKQARKEAVERTQQELSKIKEILMIQDVLTNMGQENVREDFLTGSNGAIKLTSEDLQRLDDLFTEVSPKREIEEGLPPFPEQLQKAAEHLLNLVDGKSKDVVGTTYTVLKEQIASISTCGYFDQGAAVTATEEPEVPVSIPGQIETVAEEIADEEEPVTDSVPSDTFQSMDSYANVQHQHVVEPAQHSVETAGLYISKRPVSDVLSNVMNSVSSSFTFIQESELETEVVAPTPPPASALPIPTQTFTNANYAAPPVNQAVQQTYASQPADIIYTPMPMPPQTQQPQHMPVTQPQITAQLGQEPQQQQQQPVYNNPTPQAFVSQNQPIPAQQQYNSQAEFQHPIQSGDWNEASEPPTTSDWAMESAEAGNWQNSETNDWNDQQNDGFVPAGRMSGNRGYGRGGRSGDRPRGRDSNYSGQRGNRGGSYSNNQNGRGGSGGGGGSYYRNNEEGRNNYYQNGYQNRGDGERGFREGGYNKRGGPRGGGGGGGGASRQDRGERVGPKPGGRGGNQRGGRGAGGGMNSRHQ